MRYTPLKRYKRLEGLSYEICIYCGSTSQQEDHIPPVSLQYHFEEDVIDYLVVPSCKECNIALGGKPLETVEKRLHFLFHIYTKRYPANGATSEQRSRIERIRIFLRMYGVWNPFDKIPTQQKVLYKPLPIEFSQPPKSKVVFESARKDKAPRTRAVILWEENVALKKENAGLRSEIEYLKGRKVCNCSK